MLVAFVLESSASDSAVARHDMDAVPLVDELIEIKGTEYVVRSRRWKAGRLGVSVTVTVRAVIETTT